MSSSEEDLHVDTGCQRLVFAKLLKDRTVVFNKSMVPTIIQAKEKAWIEIKDEFTRSSGKNYTVAKLKKLLNNMKSDVKRKTDRNTTGNKKIKLLEWEKAFLEMLNYEESPVFQKIPGGCDTSACDIQSSSSGKAERNVDKQNQNVSKHSELSPTQNSITKRQKKKKFKLETEETENLSASELQRLVLLEQLNAARLQAKKEQLIIDKILATENTDSTQSTSNVIQDRSELNFEMGREGLMSELREYIVM